MENPPSSVVEEKARLQAQYDAAAQSPQPSSPRSPGGRSSIAGASSSTPFEEDGLHPLEHRSATPPPYSGPSSSSQVTLSSSRQAAREPKRYPGLPAIDYRLYSPPLFEFSNDLVSIKSTAPYLSANVGALVSLIRAQSTVPPKPQVHIVGNRGRKVDFDVKLNLMSLLVPDDPRQRMDYIRCVGDGELAFRGGLKASMEPEVGDGGLEEWCRRFIEDTGQTKSFTLERVVANMDIGWLEGQIRSMIATTSYKGVVSVTFPVTHAKVIVQNPDKVHKFITSVTTFFSGKKKYEVVKAVWPFATHKNGEEGRKCLVQSEETWWREWKDPIKYAIATKRQGWVTNEDKLEGIMEGVGKGLATIDWGPEL